MPKGFKDIIKTSRGNISRTDKEFWLSVHEEYLEDNSIIITSEKLKIDYRLLKTIFQEHSLKILTSSDRRTGEVKKRLY